jgi:DNA-binding response OmpR family regulator
MASERRVLIVEDEEPQAQSMKEMLEFRGLTVRYVDSAREALAQAESFRPHVVVLDLLLVNLTDDRDGFDVIGQLRKKQGMQVGIVVLTSQYTDSRDEIRCLRAGADDYVRKAVEFGLIEARIEALLRRVLATSAVP